MHFELAFDSFLYFLSFPRQGNKGAMIYYSCNNCIGLDLTIRISCGIENVHKTNIDLTDDEEEKKVRRRTISCENNNQHSPK